MFVIIFYVFNNIQCGQNIGQEIRILQIRHMLMERPVPEIEHYLHVARLLRVATIGTLPTHMELISVLVE